MHVCHAERINALILQDAELALQQDCPKITQGEVDQLRRAEPMIDHERVLGAADTPQEQRGAAAKSTFR